MDNRKVESAFKEILERYGVDMLRDRKRFEAAVSDLLGGESCRHERIVLHHAMDSAALWILLAAPSITAAEAEKAVKQLEIESHMPGTDAQFLVRCAIAAAGMEPDTVLPEKEAEKPYEDQDRNWDGMDGEQPDTGRPRTVGESAGPEQPDINKSTAGSAPPDTEPTGNTHPDTAAAGNVNPAGNTTLAGSIPPDQGLAGNAQAGIIQPGQQDPDICILEASCKMAAHGSIFHPRGKLCIWKDRMEFQPNNPKKTAVQIDYQDITDLWTRTLPKWLITLFVLECLGLSGFLYGLKSGTWSEIVAIVAVGILFIICLWWICGRNLGVGLPDGKGSTIWFYERSVKKQAVSLIRSEAGKKRSKKAVKSIASGILGTAALMAVLYMAFDFFIYREDAGRSYAFAGLIKANSNLSEEYEDMCEDIYGIGGTNIISEENGSRNIKNVGDVMVKTGNTSGNISNGGFAAEQDGWIYYSDLSGYPYGWLCKMSSYDGIGHEVLVKEYCTHINVVGDWVYYLNGFHHICRVHTDGTGREELESEDHYLTMLTVTEEGMYVVRGSTDSNVSKGNIWYIDFNGNGRKTVTDCYYRAGMALDGGWVYFTEKNGHGLYKIRTDGSGLTRIAEETALNIQVWDGWIYFRADDTVFRIRPDGTGKETVMSSDNLEEGYEISAIHVHDTGIYAICRKSVSGAEPSVMRRLRHNASRNAQAEYLTNGESFNIAGEALFFQTYAYSADESAILDFMLCMDLTDRTFKRIYPSNMVQDLKTNGISWLSVLELYGAEWRELFQEYDLTKEEIKSLTYDVQIYGAQAGFEIYGIPWDIVKNILNADNVPWQYVFDIYGIYESYPA